MHRRIKCIQPKLKHDTRDSEEMIRVNCHFKSRFVCSITNLSYVNVHERLDFPSVPHTRITSPLLEAAGILCCFCVPWWQNRNFGWTVALKRDWMASWVLDGLPALAPLMWSHVTASSSFTWSCVTSLCFSLSFCCHRLFFCCLSLPHRESSAGICEEICLWFYFYCFYILCCCFTSHK